LLEQAEYFAQATGPPPDLSALQASIAPSLVAGFLPPGFPVALRSGVEDAHPGVEKTDSFVIGTRHYSPSERVRPQIDSEGPAVLVLLSHKQTP
jgi:hypothetical protein